MSTNCSGHSFLADDVRQYAGGALDLLEPLVERIREAPTDPDSPEPTSCAACPVCAVITVLRGGRSELAVRLADRMGDLLDVLRVALEEGGGVAPTPPADRQSGAPDSANPAEPSTAAPSGRPRSRSRANRVQHIAVSREPRSSTRRDPC